MNITREQSINLLHTYIKNENLRQHCYAVEAIMRYFAQKENEDVDFWAQVGLLHDLDWEQYPTEHCIKTAEILQTEGYPQEFIRAVQSHGWSICTDVEPIHKMEKILFALDELSGLIIATTLVRPSKSLLDLEVSSVKKKWKQPAFAAGVDRELVLKGLAMIDMSLEEAIESCITAMRQVAKELDLE